MEVVMVQFLSQWAEVIHHIPIYGPTEPPHKIFQASQQVHILLQLQIRTLALKQILLQLPNRVH